MEQKKFSRRTTTPVHFGGITVGGSAPISVQSMTNISLDKIEELVEQILRVEQAGCEIIRLAVPSISDAKRLAQLMTQLKQRGSRIPVVADIHFNAAIALEAALHVDKVRINPGNWGDRQQFIELLDICKTRKIAIRIGVNHGSLSPQIVEKYGNTPRGMVESALEFLRIAHAESFDQIVVSFKSSNTRTMIEAYRLGVEMMDGEEFYCPLHLGVTEAGEGIEGRMKSAVGIGALLVDGIGDTIRVSLSEPPENEVPAAFEILQASRARITKSEIVSCPTCGRTMYDLQSAIKEIKERFKDSQGLKIAVMGCVVNGPGEMGDADYGYVGSGRGVVNLYHNGVVVEKNIPENEAVDKLEFLINSTRDE